MWMNKSKIITNMLLKLAECFHRENANPSKTSLEFKEVLKLFLVELSMGYYK